MKFTLEPLPYEKDALEPHISAQTIEFHYGKHHAGYMNKLEKALDGKSEASLSLEALITQSPRADYFNLAAQVWNHDFYWRCMSPDGGGEPPAPLASALEQAFGSTKDCIEQLSQCAAGQFGSGWAWLVLNGNGKLEAVATGNADNPLTGGATPLLTLDVWEHAYYLDYQNARRKYIETFFGHLVNWDFVASNYNAATQ